MISIIVVGYNSKKDLPECFNSIYANTYAKYRIIFVDNDSCDGSLGFVKINYPQIITIPNSNTGYAGGNNVGIKKAIELKSDYIFLLNPDTIIDEHCLEQLIRKASSKSIIQPILLIHKNGKKTNLVNTTGNHLNFLGISYCGDYMKDANLICDKPIAGASGAAFFSSCKMYEEIGLLDENFFMYYEDMDLSWRARLSGYDIHLLTKAKVWHKYSFSKNKDKLFYADRNRLLFLNKNFSLKYRLLIFPAFVINEILMILYSLFTGWLIIKLKSYISYCKILPNQKTNRIKSAYESATLKFLEAEISFSEVTNPLFIPYNWLLKIYWKAIYIFI